MADRIHNFSAGPARLPAEVIDEARDGLLSLADTGIGILEHTHRGLPYRSVYEETVADVRDIGGISDDYEVLFLSGGASSQFHMVPMNFLDADSVADYVITGPWSKKALAEAKAVGRVHVAASTETTGFSTLPQAYNVSVNSAYLHYTSNDTICGTQFFDVPQVGEIQLVCDACSDLFSRTLDVSRFAVLYASAQKNLGPAGVTLVIVRRDLIERGRTDLPSMLQYRSHAQASSAFNTPPVFSIYVVGLMLKWIRRIGGLPALEERNRVKAETLYHCLDSSYLFSSPVEPQCRSMMNVIFSAGDKQLDSQFVSAAEKEGLIGLAGHRSAGGMRASIYNGMTLSGVQRLTEFINWFESSNAGEF